MKSLSRETKSIVMMAVVVFLGACGKEKSSDSNVEQRNTSNLRYRNVFGTWGGFPSTRTTAVTLDFLIRIDERRITNVATCTFPDGMRLVAEVSAPVEISDSSIRTLEDRSSQKESNGRRCTATIRQDEVQYRLPSDDQLELSHSGSEKVVLTRMR